MDADWIAKKVRRNHGKRQDKFTEKLIEACDIKVPQNGFTVDEFK